MTTSATIIPLSFQSPVQKCWDFYSRHGELIKNGEILVLTTFVFASKIFSSIPTVISNLALATLRYTSILFLNAQVLHLQKSAFDLHLAIRALDWRGIALTAAKVAFKSANIFLTLIGFAMPIVSLFGYATFSASMYAVLLPVSRCSWLLGCLNEISDYYQNRQLNLELRSLATYDQKKLVYDFQKLAYEIPNEIKADQHLAMRVIRQNEGATIEIFKKALQGQNDKQMTIRQANRYLKEFQSSLEHKNSFKESGTLLSGMGYASMHISKLYPDGVVEWGLRWNMSLLYFLIMIEKKIFQAEQEKQLMGPA